MAIQLRRERDPAREESPSTVGWPFGLPTCMVIHTPSTKELVTRTSHLAFHQQFVNLQTTFLLPFFSDAGSSSSSDSDARSEAASSFFKDSRRITLGSLIGLPMDHSFHALLPDAHYHVFTDADVFHDRRRAVLPCCGILELLGCARISRSSAPGFESSEDEEIGEDADVTATSTSLTAYLQLEGANPASDAACTSTVTFEDALSNGSQSPDWNDQFVSCHSFLSETGEWPGGADAAAACAAHVRARVATPKQKPSTPKQKSSPNRKMQRSSSMKSFFSSICCRIDDVERPA